MAELEVEPRPGPAPGVPLTVDTAGVPLTGVTLQTLQLDLQKGALIAVGLAVWRHCRVAACFPVVKLHWVTVTVTVTIPASAQKFC